MSIILINKAIGFPKPNIILNLLKAADDDSEGLVVHTGYYNDTHF